MQNVDMLYVSKGIPETLEKRMLHAKTRDAVVDAVFGLLRKKRVVLL